MLRYTDASDQGVYFMPAAKLGETEWDLPRATEEGFRRTISRGFIGRGASLAMGTIAPDQRSPQHESTGEHLLLGLAGVISWKAEGFDVIRMGVGDLVFIGADQSYEYWNSGDETARFVDVIGRAADWPHSTSYDGGDAVRFVVGNE